MMTDTLNHQIEYKQKAVADALSRSDYQNYLWLHERPYRLDAFLDICDELSDEKYWQLLADIWIDSESIYINGDRWVEALSQRSDESRAMMMSDEERLELSELPETITVYRGCKRDINEQGLSWTLSKSKAEWFAKRWGNDDGDVITRQIDKSEIVALLNGRGEREIILL